MRIAVIDLGTNIFNLLIADVLIDKFNIIYKDKIPVRLGENGITKNIISEKAFERGVSGIEKFNEIIKKYNCELVRVIATSAIRNANNGTNFIDDVFVKTNIKIEVIDGNKEAELIFEGVKNTINFENENVLTLDIGGGSNEFIISKNNNILFRQSYNLGMSRLIEMFNPEDVISLETKSKIEAYLKNELTDFFKICANYKVEKLIGASGVFNTITSIISTKKQYNTNTNLIKIDIDDFYSLYNQIINSSYKERLANKEISTYRAEMMVVTMVFLKFILENLKIVTLYQSEYSLKEGVMYSMIKK